MEAARKKDPSINDLTGERGQKLWKICYDMAAQDLKDQNIGDIDLLLLTTYAALVQYGIENDFRIGTTKRNGNDAIVLIHNATGKQFYTIQEAASYAKMHNKTAGKTGRQKNVQGDPVKVKVNKNKSVRSKPVSGENINVPTSVKIDRMKSNLVSTGQKAVSSMFSSSKKK